MCEPDLFCKNYFFDGHYIFLSKFIKKIQGVQPNFNQY